MADAPGESSMGPEASSHLTVQGRQGTAQSSTGVPLTPRPT